jgi:hypothetical protein
MKNKQVINNIKNITKITVTTEPGGDKKLKTIKNKDEIEDIVNYINDLDMKKTSEDVTKYSGMSYIITVYYKDKTSKEYVHYGNIFFKEMGKEWYTIPYKQAEKFESIYNNVGNK